MTNRVTPPLLESQPPERLTLSLEHRGHTYMIRCTTDVTRTEILQAFMSMLKDLNASGVHLPAENRMHLSGKLDGLIGKYVRRAVEQ